MVESEAKEVLKSLQFRLSVHGHNNRQDYRRCMDRCILDVMTDILLRFVMFIYVSVVGLPRISDFLSFSQTNCGYQPILLFYKNAM